MQVTRILVELALLGSVAATPVAAQDLQPGQQWPSELRVGRSVWLVVDENVEVEIHGKVVEVSTAGLRLRQNGDLRTIAMKDVRRIEIRDSLRNGTVVGAVIGAATVGITYAVLAATICPDCGEDNTAREISNSLEWAALGGGLRAIAGLSLDAMRKGRRAIYVAPVVSRSQSQSGRILGATVTVSW
jgi:hypothetical protein